MENYTVSPTGTKIEAKGHLFVVTNKSGQERKIRMDDLKKESSLPPNAPDMLRKINQNPAEYSFYGQGFLVHNSNEDFVKSHIENFKKQEKNKKDSEQADAMKRYKEKGKKYLYWSSSGGGYMLTHGIPDEKRPEIIVGVSHPRLRDRPVDSELARELRGQLKHSGSFMGHSNDLYEVTEDQWDKLLRGSADKKHGKQQQEKAIKSDLMKVEVPADVVAAYKSVRGNPERLPDDIDHPMYWAIRRYSPAIEAQGLAYPEISASRDTMDKIDD